MWDTIKLEVFGNFIIPDTEFKYKTVPITATLRKRFFNPNGQTFSKYGYLPKLTLEEGFNYGRWQVRRFEVEGSLPKITNGSSYFMLFEKDNDRVIQALIDVLAKFGLHCSFTEIESGNVLIIAYCYNFYLPSDYVRPKEFILPLIHLDVGKRVGNITEKLWLDVKAGYGVKFYNKMRGIGFYDKVVEITNNKFQTQQDKKVLKMIEAGELPHSFKIENTLQNRQAVKKGLAGFFDKDTKKERHIRDVLQDRISLTYLNNIFNRLADGRDVKALEQVIYPFEAYHKQKIKEGISFVDAQLLLAHAIGVQQMGSFGLKQTADKYPKFGRQYRQRYYDRLTPIVAQVNGQKLSEYFEFCKDQLKNPVIIKPFDSE
jgi:hypothetical protein